MEFKVGDIVELKCPIPGRKYYDINAWTWNKTEKHKWKIETIFKPARYSSSEDWDVKLINIDSPYDYLENIYWPGASIKHININAQYLEAF